MAAPPLDLLIVGAGPIGLAAAAAALHRGAKNILVVEQARELQPIGQTIDLLPNAYRFLVQIAPEIEPSLQPFRYETRSGKPRLRQYSADGKAINSIYTKDYGPSASVQWWKLQELLLNVLPPDILVLNHQLVDIEHDDDRDLVYAKFATNRKRINRYKNWMGDPDDDSSTPQTHEPPPPACSSKHFVPIPGEDLVSCPAKIIIGADGINSVARRCIYRDTCPTWEKFAQPLYSGISKIGSSVPKGVISEHNQSLDYVDAAEMVWLTCNQDMVSFDSMRIMLVHYNKFSKSKTDWTTIYHVAIDEERARNAADNEVQRYVVDKARNAGFSEDIISLCRKIWESSESTNVRRPYSIVPARHPPSYEPHATASNLDYPQGFKRPWYYGRVVLIGDAAHGGPPLLAQGTAMGFEDVYVLMEALSSEGVFSSREHSNVPKDKLQEAFQEYYSHRIERVCFSQKHLMNRISEYEVEKTDKVRDKLWSYSPRCVKEEMMGG